MGKQPERSNREMIQQPRELILLTGQRLCAGLFVPTKAPISIIVCIHGGGCNGRYFNLPSYSFASAAVQAGHAVLAIDRPGHGASPPLARVRALQHTVPLITDLVVKALAALGDDNLPVALFGHSIGGAVAMHCAAQVPDLSACLVTSGIGVQPTRAAMGWHGDLSCANNVVLPHEFFFGPEGSYDWQAPIALRKCAEPWRKAEIDEILLEWPNQFKSVAERIASPTLCILSEYERIWENDAAAIEAIKSGFTIARASVKVVGGGGHLYEVHRRWSTHFRRVISYVEQHIR